MEVELTMIHRNIKIPDMRNIIGNEKGFLLIAALTLMATLTLLGTTAYILSSTDIKIGGNFRNNQMVLQVAMAGAERARELLRLENLGTGDSSTFSDELNKTSRKGANNVLDGYSATTDDVALASGTMNNVSYVAYLTNDSSDGSSNTTDSNGKVLITSVGTGPNNSKAQVQIVVTASQPPSSPAVIYSKGDVTGNGSSLTINGNDSCGAASALAPVYTKDPATTNLNGTPTLSGSPPTPQHGSLDIDIPGYIAALQPGATTILTADQNGATYGSPTNYVTAYSDTNNPPNNQGLKLQNVTGYGILIVEGDLTFGGGFQWNGLIFATGSITLNGGGGGINIQGLIFSGTSTLTDVTINGGNVIGYDSCKVKKALATQALKVVNWKQSY
jgi:Tfp pilus assembly protein PilX